MFIEKLIKDGKVDGTWFEDWWNKELDDRKVAARSSKALEQKTNKELDPKKPSTIWFSKRSDLLRIAPTSYFAIAKSTPTKCARGRSTDT